MDIIEKARELGQMIADSEEMELLKISEESLYQDVKANSIINELKLLQHELGKAFEQEDQQVIESIKEKVTLKYEEANSNEIVKNYFEAIFIFTNLLNLLQHYLLNNSLSIFRAEASQHVF
jgi:cell fate (sporulation/competence/biofilm development) regulator YlbF (YheA/YmcA/DUF963 family)